MKPVRRLAGFVFVPVLTMFLLVSVSSTGFAQANNTAKIRQLSTKQEQLQLQFLNETAKLATEYESLGEFDLAQDLLRQMLKINNDLPKVKDKLKELEESSLNKKVIDVMLDATSNWVSTKVRVVKDKPVQFLADGSIRFTYSGSSGPDGIVGADVTKEMSSKHPIGAVLGMVVPSQRRRGNQNKDVPDPILIGSKREFRSKEAGELFLKINLPAGVKANGKIKVSIRGGIEPLTGR